MGKDLSSFHLDVGHGLLMAGALALAYALPFELVLLSYALLGPLHYLTEISWLHERSYFLPGPKEISALLLVFFCFMAISVMTIVPLSAWFLWAALALSIGFIMGKTNISRILISLFLILSGVSLFALPKISLIIFILLPTVIHVVIFTFIFMVLGALRHKSLSQALLVLGYGSALIFLCVFPPHAALHSFFEDANAEDYFGDIGRGMGLVFGSDAWPLNARFAGFLSFVYTYHYLNWFIKVGTIKWHKVPGKRLFIICGLSFALSAIYFINYQIGFALLLTLSLLHVLLELPLNVLSFKELAAQLRLRTKRAN